MKRPAFAGVAVMMLIAGGCGGDGSTTTATPAVSPSPASTPSPAPTPSAVAQCNLPPVNVDQHTCRAESPLRYESVMVQAQDQVKREHPELFDNSGKVFRRDAYTGWVSYYLRTTYGYCAVGGTNDEVSIKKTNDFSELYDLVTGDNGVWTGYVFTCRPPLF